MGICYFPNASEGVFPVLLKCTLLPVALLKDVIQSKLVQIMGINENYSDIEEMVPNEFAENYRERKIYVTLFETLCNNESCVVGTSNGGWSSMECCVCLYEFEGDEEVSELSCKHFFHKGCLDKWLDYKHSTCPLCRSSL